MKIAPFATHVSDAAVADPARRLDITRWPVGVGDGGGAWLAARTRSAEREAKGTDMPFAGHFAALEQPLARASDIREAFTAFR